MDAQLRKTDIVGFVVIVSRCAYEIVPNLLLRAFEWHPSGKANRKSPKKNVLHEIYGKCAHTRSHNHSSFRKRNCTHRDTRLRYLLFLVWNEYGFDVEVVVGWFHWMKYVWKSFKWNWKKKDAPMDLFSLNDYIVGFAWHDHKIGVRGWNHIYVCTSLQIVLIIIICKNGWNAHEKKSNRIQSLLFSHLNSLQSYRFGDNVYVKLLLFLFIYSLLIRIISSSCVYMCAFASSRVFLDLLCCKGKRAHLEFVLKSISEYYNLSERAVCVCVRIIFCFYSFHFGLVFVSSQTCNRRIWRRGANCKWTCSWYAWNDIHTHAAQCKETFNNHMHSIVLSVRLPFSLILMTFSRTTTTTLLQKWIAWILE